MIRVILADDHSVVRSGFKMILESDPEIEIIGEAANGDQAYSMTIRERPDIILLDVSMPSGQNGLTTCQKLSHDCPQTKIIILTMFAEPEYLRFTMENGAAGYVIKNATVEELKEAVHTVAEGGTYIHPTMQNALASLEKNFENKPSIASLSHRELDILILIARGYTNKQIAEQLFISIKTVEAHRSKIYSKLNLKTRADAVDYAIKHKLMTL